MDERKCRGEVRRGVATAWREGETMHVPFDKLADDQLSAMEPCLVG